MQLLTEHYPALIIMLLIAALAAFCSACEASFFSLTIEDRKTLAKGNRLQRLAAQLAEQSDRILPAILLWNLSANLIVFAISTIVSLKLQRTGHAGEAGILALAALFGVIIFCEMMPKDLGVSFPRRLTPLLVVPLTILVRIVRPLIPILEKINLLSQRLFFPKIKPEAYLHVSDLERMVDLSSKNATFLKREQRVLRNIVSLSDTTAEEMMRPRTMLRLYKSPVTLESLQGELPASGYLLITEPESDEIVSAIQLDRFAGDPGGNEIVWDAESNPVVYVPWLMKVSAVLEELQKAKKEVAAVVNEYGETIGILTFDDLVYSIFALLPSRSRLLLNQSPISHKSDNLWHVSGITNLRRIERLFQIELPEHDASTVSGLLQEVFERLPEPGDECDWGPFHWKIITVTDNGVLEIEMYRNDLDPDTDDHLTDDVTVDDIPVDIGKSNQGDGS